MATTKAAFSKAYADWYLKATKDTIPPKVDSARELFTTGLFRCYDLPSSTDEQSLEKNTLAVLQVGWKQMGLVFPTKTQIVHCHQINLPMHYFVTVHAGVLIPRQRGFAYVEKSGGRGPFVRVDFQERGDLALWLSAIFKGAEQQGYTHHFVTFNDNAIVTLEPEKR